MQSVVAASHPRAVEVGLEILRKGGNAVDAAIAVNAALAVVEPTACGLGGDLAALVWDADSIHGLLSYGGAPAAGRIGEVPALPDGTIDRYSPWSWTVPGCVAGWRALHERMGSLAWRALLQPAAELARSGVRVPPVIARGWASGQARFSNHPGFAEVFLPGGAAPIAGQVFHNPALAETLERVQRGGAEEFYSGETARRLVAYSREVGGPLALEDLARPIPAWVDPITTRYRDVDLWELPPPGQGLAALQMLDILSQLDLQGLGPDDPDRWHLMVEAKKAAYEDRARHYADPDFLDLPALRNPERVRRQAERIDRARAALCSDLVELSAGETTILAVGDAAGTMISLIQSNYTGFGSGYAAPSLGFGIQNRGAQFSLNPDHPNALAPGKRPFHTIIPALLGREGIPVMAFGLMGGDMQPQGHVQIVVDLIDLGMSLQAAGDAPRFHHAGSSEPTGVWANGSGVLHLEPEVPSSVSSELARRGHRIEAAPVEVFGGYQAVRRDPRTGGWEGATERRKDGIVGGIA